MCYNCGCFNPNDDMGDSNNITNEMLKELAKRQNIALLEVKKQLLFALEDNSVNTPYEEMFEKAAKAWGQSVNEAKKETRKLLAHELKHA